MSSSTPFVTVSAISVWMGVWMWYVLWSVLSRLVKRYINASSFTIENKWESETPDIATSQLCMRCSSLRTEVLQLFFTVEHDDVLSAVISREMRIREVLMMPLIRKRLRVNLQKQIKLQRELIITIHYREEWEEQVEPGRNAGVEINYIYWSIVIKYNFEVLVRKYFHSLLLFTSTPLHHRRKYCTAFYTTFIRWL